MKFNYTTLETCHTASGLVIVIDVLRAFSNAAYAFSRGAKEIMLVSTVLLMGALTFVPALALGPIVEQLQMIAR